MIEDEVNDLLAGVEFVPPDSLAVAIIGDVGFWPLHDPAGLPEFNAGWTPATAYRSPKDYESGA
jgi:hypothetical protein